MNKKNGILLRGNNSTPQSTARPSEMGEERTFSYQGSAITFNKGDSVMVNATQMAKPFGKEPKFWLMNRSASNYINELSKVRNLTLADLVQVTKGGSNPGTWMHEDVALEFARWLSPAFSVWCNDRIKELLATGVATVSDDDETVARAMEILQRRLERANADNAALERRNASLAREIEEAAPKARYCDGVLRSESTMTTTQVAKGMGMTAKRLHGILWTVGVIFPQSSMWMLREPYSKWGLHKVRTALFVHGDGTTGTRSQTVWTEKGKLFINAMRESGWNTKRAALLLAEKTGRPHEGLLM